MELLRTVELTKKFKLFTAVDSVELHLERGSIYGLIGRNGAGKTTILRMIAGFANPTSGSVSFDENGGVPLRIGALIEAPGLYPNFSAFRNLEIKRVALGLPDSGICRELLTFVGLSQWADVKTKSFSLGMKQRLGIALALLGEPDLLILDEPTNGLDPAGIADFRRMMTYLSRERGMTILISSHQLEELSKIITHCGILESGKLVREDSFSDIQASMMTSLKIVSDSSDRVKEVLNAMDIYGYQVKDGNTVHLMEALQRRDEILKRLIESDVHITECTPVYDSLEDYYMDITKGAGHEKYTAL